MLAESIYRTLVQTRLFESRIVVLHRQGQISIFATSEGEEAIAVASAAALKREDWLFPDYRSTGALFARGVSLEAYLSQLLGTAGDSSKGRQMPTHYASREQKIASVSTPVGNNIVHAVGLAWAAKLRKGPEAVLVLFGDGATSSDGFHAGMNIAGVHRLPIVFVCRNNQYAISLPLSQQTASKSIAIKAEAYGFPGLQIDGNDALGVYGTVQAALERARSGEGPTLIEAIAFRLGAHTTSDDARRYRSDDQLKDWRKRDCIERLRDHLVTEQNWNPAKDEELRKTLTDQIDRAVKQVTAEPPPPTPTLFDDVYAQLPRHLLEQREELL
jgi:TPP-dependent pyruvate/acetoin dehydrogenase alpha subunit